MREVGVIVDSYSADTFAVECVDAQGMTLWLAVFHLGEIEPIEALLLLRGTLELWRVADRASSRLPLVLLAGGLFVLLAAVARDVVRRCLGLVSKTLLVCWALSSVYAAIWTWF